MKQIPKITEAEYEVMKVLWRKSPAGTNEIVEQVLPQTGWQPNTVHTLLKRLVKKEALAYRKEGRMFVYRPLVTEKEYLEHTGKNFLDRYFGGNIAPLLASYLEETVSGEELEKLKWMLDGRLQEKAREEEK